MICVLCALLVSAPISGQDARETVPVEDVATGDSGAPASTVGFIFTTSDLLLDIDAYRGGFGLKLRYPDAVLRPHITFGYASTHANLEIAAGVTYEKPFFPGRVVPYWGLLASVLFRSERSEVDAENYTQVRGLTGSAGAVLGAEVFVLDFFSVFADYQLALDLAYSAVAQSVDGTVTESTRMNYAFGAGLGNDASIGLVVYLRPVGMLESCSGQE